MTPGLIVDQKSRESDWTKLIEAERRIGQKWFAAYQAPQAIVLTNAALLLIGPLRTKFREIWSR